MREMFKFIKNKDISMEEISGTGLSFWQDVIRTFFKNKAAAVSLVFLILLIVMAIIGPYTGVNGITADAGRIQNTNHKLVSPKVPGLEWIPLFDGIDRYGKDTYEDIPDDTYYYAGTDRLGRDMWVRIWNGVRISLLIGFAATIIDLGIGVTVGGLAGYYGGKVDFIISRITEVLSTIPMLLIVIILIVLMNPGILPVIVAIAVTGWVGMSRMVRNLVFRNKEHEYVYASKALGASNRRLIYLHILPNTFPMILVWLMFTIPGAIFTEAFLAFIGLGVTIPDASLGSLISTGRESMANNPHLLVFPATILALIMIVFNLCADGLRDAFDPKSRGSE